MAKTYEFIGGLHVPLKFAMDTPNYHFSKELPVSKAPFLVSMFNFRGVHCLKSTTKLNAESCKMVLSFLGFGIFSCVFGTGAQLCSTMILVSE